MNKQSDLNRDDQADDGKTWLAERDETMQALADGLRGIGIVGGMRLPSGTPTYEKAELFNSIHERRSKLEVQEQARKAGT